MLFNRQTFNHGAVFNRTADSYVLSGEAICRFVPAGQMASIVPFGMQYADFTMVLPSIMLVGIIPLSAAGANIAFSTQGNMRADANYYNVSTGITFALSESSLRASNDTQLELTGINLEPGDTLIIDTESLNIFLNGQLDVTSWVVGSDFFDLLKGVNEITVYDDQVVRTLDMLIVWADRWL